MKRIVFTAFYVSLLYLLFGCTKGVDEIGEMKVVLIKDWSSPTFAYEVFFKTDRSVFHLEFSETCTLKGDAEVNMDGDGFPLSVCQKAFTTHSAGSYRIVGREHTKGNKLSTCTTTSLLVTELEILKRGEGPSYVFLGWYETPGARKLVTDPKTGSVGPEIITREGVYASVASAPTGVLNGKLSVNGPMETRLSNPPASWANCDFSEGTQIDTERVEAVVVSLDPNRLEMLGIEQETLRRVFNSARDVFSSAETAAWPDLFQEAGDLEVVTINGNFVRLRDISLVELRYIEISEVGIDTYPDCMNSYLQNEDLSRGIYGRSQLVDVFIATSNQLPKGQNVELGCMIKGGEF